jgi:hypothetical protein
MNFDAKPYNFKFKPGDILDNIDGKSTIRIVRISHDEYYIVNNPIGTKIESAYSTYAIDKYFVKNKSTKLKELIDEL